MRLETRFWRTWLVLQVCSLSAASAKSGDLMTSSAQIHRQHRARQRELRKKSIKNYIEQQFNWANKVMPTGEEVRERVREMPELPDMSLATISPPRAGDPP